MLNVAVIGLGRMGRLHLMNCTQIEGVKIVAAADTSKKALGMAKKFGVSNLYTDYNNLLEHGPDLDAVIITLPNFMHFRSIKSALQAGLHVFTEKPMATTVSECREIVRLVQKSGRKFMVGHNLRFIDAVEKMKSAADDGNIGNVEVITIEEIINGPFSHPAFPVPVSDWWFDSKKSGGGALLDIGYHLIDLFHHFVGARTSEVLFASLDHKFNLLVEDGAIVILGCPDSTVKGIINVGWWQKTVFPRFNFRLILHGNAGYISSDELIPRNLYVHAIGEGAKNLVRKICGRKIKTLSYTYFYESYFKELNHFFECIKSDLDPGISANDGLKTVEIIEEIYKRS